MPSPIHTTPLQRFIAAQEASYATALAEIKNGCKESHWMWYGSPDDIKLRSSMTLFAQVENAPPIFQSVIEKFFGGKADGRTLELLEKL